LPVEVANDLEWLLAQLGPARDWDVLAGSTLPKVGAAAQTPELVALTMAALEKTHALHHAAAEAIASERYRQLMLALSTWVNERAWRAGVSRKVKQRLKGKVERFAEQVLAADQKRLLRRGAQLRSATPEARHRVRIAAKKARYAAEFFSDLLPAKEVKAYVKCLSRLQERLGRLNDLAVAAKLLPVLENSGHSHDGAFARGYVSGLSDEASHGLRDALDKVARLKLVH
jgi:CHAD domain-containing protein